MLRATGDIAGAVDAFQESLIVLQGMAAENPDHYATNINLANVHALIGRNLGDPNGPSLRKTAAAVEHLEESLRIGRRLMALDATDNQVRSNHAIAAWRLGDAVRAADPTRSLAAYDEAIAILRPIKGKRFNRDVPLTATLAESSAALLALGRTAEAKARLEEAGGICEAYRGAIKAVHETCAEYTTRARAALAMTQRRPLEAIAALREWLTLTSAEQNTQEAHDDLYSAYMLSKRYLLLAEAHTAAGQAEETARVQAKRRELVDWWSRKLTSRNAELFLSH
jgi:hypothetical protein